MIPTCRGVWASASAAAAEAASAAAMGGALRRVGIGPVEPTIAQPGTLRTTHAVPSAAVEPEAPVDPGAPASAPRDLPSIVGICSVVLGLSVLATSETLAFDPAALSAALGGALPETLPAAILVGAAWLLDLTAGAALARWTRRTPFETVSDLVLEGFVGAVVLNVAALYALGGLGWFRMPVLVAIQLAAIASLRWARPVLVPATVARLRAWRPSSPSPAMAFIGLAWSGALVMQLTHSVVPFMDVLPNHVAPAEHLRAFGGLDPLSTTPSPIYGSSRSLLGYTAVLATITVTTGLPAGLAIAGSILPGLLLVAIAVRRLGAAVGGPAVGELMLLSFTLTASFARLADARATVLVLPLAL